MRNKLKTPLIVGGLSILGVILPLVPTLVAALIANANNCILNEGSIHPCVVLGIDLGQTLYAMGMSFWLVLFSLPLGALGLVVSVVWFVIALIKKEECCEKSQT